MCKGCGRLDNKPLGMNKNGEPYLACCPDSDYRIVLAVEYLEEQINHYSFCFGMPPNMNVRIDIPKEILEQAKELEKQQKQNYLIEYFAWHKSMGFVSHTPEDIIEFNQTYGGNK